MEHIKFTDPSVRALKGDPAGKRIVWILGCPGFGVRVSQSGKKSFVSKHEFNGKDRLVTLGVYPSMTLKDAHEMHLEYIDRAAHGIDMRAGLTGRGMTVRDFLEDEYFEHRRKSGVVSWDDERSIFRVEVIPEIGALSPENVTPDQIKAILYGSLARLREKFPDRPTAGQSYVQHLRTSLRVFFDWCEDRGVIKVNPAAGVKRISKMTVSDRVLSPAEIWLFWNRMGLSGAGSNYVAALKFLLVTGQRTKEVRSLKWSDIDEVNRIWTISSAEAKNRRMHRAPLGDLAMVILKGQKGGKAVDRDAFVFPGEGKDGKIGEKTLAQIVRKTRDAVGVSDFSPHDLRRTAATLITAMGLPTFYASLLLNHVQQGVTNRVYVQYSYDSEKRKAVAVLDTALSEIIKAKSPDKVPSLEAVRKKLKNIVV